MVGSGACNNDVQLSSPYYVLLLLVIAFVNFSAILSGCVMLAAGLRRITFQHTHCTRSI